MFVDFQPGLNFHIRWETANVHINFAGGSEADLPSLTGQAYLANLRLPAGIFDLFENLRSNLTGLISSAEALPACAKNPSNPQRNHCRHHNTAGEKNFEQRNAFSAIFRLLTAQ